VSNYGSATLTIANENGILGTVLASDAPVGIDLRLRDGLVEVASTGFTDNTYRVTAIAPADGSVVSNVANPLPEECTDPGHAAWMPDSRMAVSCRTSANLALIGIP
jgi:hypothetical protein